MNESTKLENSSPKTKERALLRAINLVNLVFEQDKELLTAEKISDFMAAYFRNNVFDALQMFDEGLSEQQVIDALVGKNIINAEVVVLEAQKIRSSNQGKTPPKEERKDDDRLAKMNGLITAFNTIFAEVSIKSKIGLSESQIYASLIDNGMPGALSVIFVVSAKKLGIIPDNPSTLLPLFAKLIAGIIVVGLAFFFFNRGNDQDSHANKQDCSDSSLQASIKKLLTIEMDKMSEPRKPSDMLLNPFMRPSLESDARMNGIKMKYTSINTDHLTFNSIKNITPAANPSEDDKSSSKLICFTTVKMKLSEKSADVLRQTPDMAATANLQGNEVEFGLAYAKVEDKKDMYLEFFFQNPSVALVLSDALRAEKEAKQ
jgi:DNA-binding phage protein